MLTPLHEVMYGRRRDRGFTLIELLIVVLIVGILAAVATPLYLGYVRDAKTAEAKAQAGSLWTALQSQGVAKCDTAIDVSEAYPKGGFDTSGQTTPARWTVTQKIGNFNIACSNGLITPDNTTVFTISGDAAAKDVSFIKVKLVYSSGSNPPSKLKCDTTGVDIDC